MKRLKYIFLVLLLIPAFFLSSCGNNSFYSRFKAVGAEIEEKNCFVELKLDEVVEKKAKDNFVLIILSSDNSTSGTVISNLQFDADNTNFEGKIFVYDVKSPTAKEGLDITSKLGITSYTDSSTGFVAVGYKNNSKIFDTSNGGSECDVFRTTTSQANIHAVFNYIAEGIIEK